MVELLSILMNPKLKAKVDSFVKYCEQNPDQRFWQALTNWAGMSYVGHARTPSGTGFVDLWHNDD